MAVRLPPLRVILDVLPRAPVIVAASEPAETRTAPVKSLAALRVRVPTVFLVKPRVPVRLAEIVPVSIVIWDTSIVPPVRVPPAKVRVLAIGLPFKSRVPPVLIVTELAPSACTSPRVTCPASSVKPPEKVLAWLRIRVPAPVLVMPVLPARIESIVVVMPPAISMIGEIPPSVIELPDKVVLAVKLSPLVVTESTVAVVA